MFQKRFLASFVNAINFDSTKIEVIFKLLIVNFTGAKLNNLCIRSSNGVNNPAIFPIRNQPIMTPVKT